MTPTSEVTSPAAPARPLVREHRPDILILDMAMPRMSGLDTSYNFV